HQVNEVSRIDETRDDPDDKAESTQVHAYKLVDMRTLDFDGYRFATAGQYSFMHLAQRSGSRTLAFQHAKNFFHRLAQFAFEYLYDVFKGLCRYLILQFGQHGQGLFR